MCWEKIVEMDRKISDFPYMSPFSSVAEHWSRKPGVVSSNLTGGIDYFYHSHYFLKNSNFCASF